MFDVGAGVSRQSDSFGKIRSSCACTQSYPANYRAALKRAFGLKMIFDVRGLIADEYVDAGHWSEAACHTV